MKALAPPSAGAPDRVICARWERLPVLAYAGLPVVVRVGVAARCRGGPDFPLMAEWVCDPGEPPAVFVCRRGGGGGTCGDRVVEDRLGVIDDEEVAAGRAADRLGVDALAG